MLTPFLPLLNTQYSNIGSQIFPFPLLLKLVDYMIGGLVNLSIGTAVQGDCNKEMSRDPVNALPSPDVSSW